MRIGQLTLSPEEAAASFSVSGREFRRYVVPFLRDPGAIQPEDLRDVIDLLPRGVDGAWVSGKAKGSIYFAEAIGAGRVKIGWTGGRVADRLDAFRTACPFDVRCILSLPGGTPDGERWLHERFAALTAKRGSEWFHLRTPILDYVRAMRSRM